MLRRYVVVALLSAAALVGVQVTGIEGAAAAPGPSLVLTQLVGTEALGADHVMTATYTPASGGADGVLISFVVTAGPDIGQTASCTPGDCMTAADGDVNGTYTSFTPGTDTVTAYADLDSSGTQDAGEPSATVDVTWVVGNPTAASDAILTTLNTPADYNVLDNDTAGSPDGLQLTAPLSATTTTGGHVDVLCDSSGACHVTPHTGFTGSETFTYSVDNGAHTASGTVTVNVYPPRKILVYGPTGNAADGLAESTPGVIVDTWDTATWATKTTADFAKYDAIVFGDQPACGVSPSDWGAALTNRAVWSAAVDGPVVALGTDTDFHNKPQLVHQAVEFAAGGGAGKTGLYVALSCAYDDGATTPEVVDLLGGFGTFKVLPAGCNNAAHIVATHPALNGLDDGYLSNWSCSTHELFTEFPPSFAPLAIAKTDVAPDGVTLYHASDGTQGLVYILASGATQLGLSLTPVSGSAGAGGAHQVTATLATSGGAPISGDKIVFAVTAGPNSGVTGTCAPVTCLTGADGKVSWTYTSGATPGTDTIRAIDDKNTNGVLDSGEGQATAGMTWASVAANQDPVAGPDTLDTTKNTVGSLNVLGNDSDADGNALSLTGPLTATATVQGGSVICTGAGDCDYTPPTDFVSPPDDNFTYTVSDGQGGSAQGTVTVTVHDQSAVDHAPVAVADDVTTTVGTPVDVDVLANDSDPDFDPLSLTAPASTPVNGSTGKGTVTCVDTGTCTYVPKPGASGVDTFSYTIDDGRGQTANALVTVHITDCPDLRPGLDGGALVTGYSWVACSAVDANAVSTLGPPVLTPVGGSDALLTSGQAALAAPPNDSSGAGRSNGNGVRGGFDVSILQLNLNVPAGNNCLRFDFEFGSEEYPEYVNSSFNDGFLAELDTSDWSIDPGAVGSPISAPHDFALDPDGKIVSINSGFFGSGSVVTANNLQYDGSTPLLRAQTPVTPGAHKLFLSIFDAGDGILDSGALVDNLATAVTSAGQCTAGVVSNRPPTAAADSITTAEDVAKTFAASTLKANDSDPDGDSLAVTDVAATGSTLGTVGFSAGNVTYTPPANFHGTDSFAYTLDDGHGHQVTGTVTVTVTPVNDAPVAVTDTKTTPEDTPLSFPASDLAANDTDVDGDALTVTAVGTPTHGTVSLSAGTVTFTPAANYHGPASFGYAVSDGHGGTASGTVNVTVTPVNDNPVAVDDAKTGVQDQPLTFAASTLAANDTDVDGDVLSVSAVSNPTHGTVDLTSGSITFTPEAGFCCTVGFDYTVSDGHGGTDVGHVTVTLSSGPPVAGNDSLSTLTDQPASLDVLANDTDPEGDALSVMAFTDAAHGYAWCYSFGECFYESLPGYRGPDSFTYTVTDGHGGKSVGTIAVTVRLPVHLDATIAGSLTTKVEEGKTVTVTGTLRRLGSTAGVAGEPVKIFAKLHSAATWPGTPVATLTTNASGVVSKTFAPTASTDYRLVHDASGFVLADTSATATAYTYWTLASTVAPVQGFRLVGAAATVSGSVRPAKPGASIFLRKLAGTTWSTVATTTLSGSGTYSLPIASRTTPGTDRYQVVMPADADHNQNSVTFDVVTNNGPVAIMSVVRKATTLNGEVVVLKNLSGATVNLKSYRLLAQTAKATYLLPSYNLAPGASVTVHTGTGTNTTGHIYLRRTTMLWNDLHDTARLSRPTAVVAWTYIW